MESGHRERDPSRRKDACNTVERLLSFSFDTGLFLVYAWA